MTRYAVLPFFVVALASATSADQESEEEACALQVHHAKQVRAAKDQTCAVGDLVPCPGSGSMCAGEQCCPRPDEGITFPCPSAPPGWSKCEQPAKESNCVVADSSVDTFTAQCQAWVDGTGPKPTTCDEKLDGCYKGGPPISAADGAWCVAGKMTTWENYCTALEKSGAGTCQTDDGGPSVLPFRSAWKHGGVVESSVETLTAQSPVFTVFEEQCWAWKHGTGTGEKPTTCDLGMKSEACYQGIPPVSVDDGAWCVAGKMTTCENYCKEAEKRGGSCQFEEGPLCAPVSSVFEEQCSAWKSSDLTGPKPTTCDFEKLDACFKGIPPLSIRDGAWCVAGKMTTCQNYCTALEKSGAGTCQTDVGPFCATVFADQCQAWTDGTGPKPTTCDDQPLNFCLHGSLPISAADSAWCVAGKMTTCENYCKEAEKTAFPCETDEGGTCA